jgi:photosynthetic reaction center cytochrome c subunit
MPADQLGKVMNIIASSLGKDCNFCHVGDQWDKDDKKEKATAREMMKMTFGINKDSFKGRTEVTCNTCHNGNERPQAVPNLMPVAEVTRPVQPPTKPSVDQIIEKYLTAIGGTAKLARITSRTIKANRLESDGKTIEPEMIAFKAHKYIATTTYPKAVVTECFDGVNSWKFTDHSINLKADEAEAIKREADLFMPADLKAVYPKMDFRAVDLVDGQQVNVVIATTAAGFRERLAFDVSTGLLVRRTAVTPTVLGSFVYQVDYADYKVFGGVKIPTTIRYSMPNIRWTRKVLEVKNNVPVDDARFDMASGAPK